MKTTTISLRSIFSEAVSRGVVLTLPELTGLDVPSGGTKAENNPLRDADVVIGRHADTQNVSLFYGRETLRTIELNGGAGKRLSVVCVDIGGDETDDIEVLCAMLTIIKGRDDYVGADQH